MHVYSVNTCTPATPNPACIVYYSTSSIIQYSVWSSSDECSDTECGSGTGRHRLQIHSFILILIVILIVTGSMTLTQVTLTGTEELH